MEMLVKWAIVGVSLLPRSMLPEVRAGKHAVVDNTGSQMKVGQSTNNVGSSALTDAASVKNCKLLDWQMHS